jgi:exodeoxyribonuclease VII small subunit
MAKKEMQFESALKRLEEIVGKLEQDENVLEESLKLFEEGIKLSTFCSVKLNEVKKKVEVLTTKEGKLQKEDYLAE